MKESIKIHDKTFKPFLSHEEILKSIDSVAAKINADFAGCEDVPIILCVLNGAIVFTGELLQSASRDQEEILIQTYDLEALRKDRLSWGLFRDRRPECYGDITK